MNIKTEYIIYALIAVLVLLILFKPKTATFTFREAKK